MAEKSPTENPTPSPEVENEWKRIWAKIGNVHQSKTKEVSMDSKWISLGKRMAGWLAILIGILILVEIYRDWSEPRNDARERYHAASKRDIARYDAERRALEKGITAPVIGAQVAGVTYDCNSAQSVEAGFRKGRIHYLSEDQSTTVTGCVWLAIDQTVSDISGENFLIEFPTEKISKRIDSSLYEKSPSSYYPNPTAFWNRISEDSTVQNKVVRVLVVKDGFVSITK